MLSFLVVALAWLVLRRQLGALEHGTPLALAPKKVHPQLAQLTSYANRLYAERKWNSAEKAYLNVLKLDHKNVTAYTHLGIIYSTQKSMADAIECFTIAARLQATGSTLQNLALAYFDNKNYMKAIATYEKSIMMEPTAQRYVGLGKSNIKLHNTPAAITAFENAVSLDPNKRNLSALADLYDEAKRASDALANYERIYQIDPTDRTAARKLNRPADSPVNLDRKAKP